jgi:hypothetical protein
MLTFEDCMGLCDLTPEEIAAIAEHEHLPEIVALQFGNYLIHQPNGVPAIRRMIIDDIEAARRHGDHRHALALKLVLRHFCHAHRQELSRIPPSATDVRKSLERLRANSASA